MARGARVLEPVRWSMNDDAWEWFVGLGEQLHINPSVLMRMFVLQLKEGDPVTHRLVYDFVELGLREALLRPRAAKVFVEQELAAWLREFAATLQHRDYPKRRVWPRHLLTGYVRYLQQHHYRCVKYGAVRLEELVQ